MSTVLTHECRFEIMEWTELEQLEAAALDGACMARKKAMAPVSHFTVGACILTNFGTFFVGCNIEDITHNGCIHAEMAALAAMITNNHCGHRIKTIAIVLDNAEVEITIPPKRSAFNIGNLKEVTYTPCGHCRTVLSQHQAEGTPIRILALQPNGQILVTSINDLYPLGFGFTPSR